MPFLTIHTNAVAGDKDGFVKEATDFVAAELRKPISYVIVTLNDGENMIFGGRKEVKSALVEMKSIGFANKAELAKKLTTFLSEKLGLDKSFVNIHFIDMPAGDLSIGGNLLG